ncbi:MAG: hypothetical protein ACHREM_01040 [Polyangiales bacterium]
MKTITIEDTKVELVWRHVHDEPQWLLYANDVEVGSVDNFGLASTFQSQVGSADTIHAVTKSEAKRACEAGVKAMLSSDWASWQKKMQAAAKHRTFTRTIDNKLVAFKVTLRWKIDRYYHRWLYINGVRVGEVMTPVAKYICAWRVAFDGSQKIGDDMDIPSAKERCEIEAMLLLRWKNREDNVKEVGDDPVVVRILRAAVEGAPKVVTKKAS